MLLGQVSSQRSSRGFEATLDEVVGRVASPKLSADLAAKPY